MLDITPSEMQAFDPEAIILARPILLDIAARFQGGEQSKNIVLMQLEALGKFGYAKLIDIAKKLLHHVERVRDRLDQVIGFVASDYHLEFSNERPPDQPDGSFWEGVLI